MKAHKRKYRRTSHRGLVRAKALMRGVLPCLPGKGYKPSAQPKGAKLVSPVVAKMDEIVRHWSGLDERAACEGEALRVAYQWYSYHDTGKARKKTLNKTLFAPGEQTKAKREARKAAKARPEGPSPFKGIKTTKLKPEQGKSGKFIVRVYTASSITDGDYHTDKKRVAVTDESGEVIVDTIDSRVSDHRETDEEHKRAASMSYTELTWRYKAQHAAWRMFVKQCRGDYESRNPEGDDKKANRVFRGHARVALIKEGDTLQQPDGTKVKNPDTLLAKVWPIVNKDELGRETVVGQQLTLGSSNVDIMYDENGQELVDGIPLEDWNAVLTPK